METYFNPVTAILITLLAAVTALWLFWPEKGLWAQLARLSINSQRIILEDALKFLYDCEYKGIKCQPNDLARNLNISKDKSERLLKRLLSINLVLEKNKEYHLNDKQT